MITIDDLHTRVSVTVPEAAQLLGLERKTAYNAAGRGELPTIKFGRRLLVPTQALLDMLAGAQ